MYMTTLQSNRSSRRLVLLLLFQVPLLYAGVPEPDTIIYGTLSLNGRAITAADTNVIVQAHLGPGCQFLARANVGSDSSQAASFYVLRVPTESDAAGGAAVAQLGVTLQIVVSDNSTIQDQQS